MSPVNAIVAIRANIGLGAWAAPRLAGRLFGLDAEANPQLPYVGRLFGVRDIALAAGVRASSGTARRLWLKIGMACDAADVAAGLIAGRNGEISKVSTVLVTVPALMGIGLGLAALSQGDGEPALA
jgi:hypothetical protein